MSWWVNCILIEASRNREQDGVAGTVWGGNGNSHRGLGWGGPVERPEYVGDTGESCPGQLLLARTRRVDLEWEEVGNILTKEICFWKLG